MEMDRWYHVAATYDGEKVRLYVDGQNDGSFDVSGALNMIGDLKLGSRSIDSEFFQGAIDNVRIFSRNLDALELKIWSDELHLDQTEPVRSDPNAIHPTRSSIPMHQDFWKKF